ncbi:siroheme synthase [Thalassotalea ponticola]|uniref:precorrin-2 dehydrogenase/sirohydrochlorin ferrochelatase family protein n=1 Tax=Thalassotalea ponticola TaxID=1523392 RepID=UPI0025B57827|nr:siroheme synthase [Thalassotalea ponticola]MDN3652835.1 siroheme synthase [Thalassotalea ponticola]
MRYLPIFIDAEKITALVIGGGEIAARKLELLVKTPAKVSVLSPVLSDSCQQLLTQHRVTYIANHYQPGSIGEQYNLVIAATDNGEINKQIATECQHKNILLNVVDEPALCTYITPAIIDRNPILIALSSSGSAPMLLQLLKQQLDLLLPADYGKLAAFMGKHRKQVQQSIPNFSARRALWQQVVQSEIGQAIFDDDEQQAELGFDALLDQQLQKHNKQTVTLIKLSTEHVDDLSLRAYRALQSCDAVLFEPQLMKTFSDYCRKDANKYPSLDSKKMDELSQQMNVCILVKSEDEYQRIKQHCLLNTIYCGH